LNSSTPAGIHGMSLAARNRRTQSPLLPAIPFIERRINAELAYCPDVAVLAEVAPAAFGMLR